MPTTVTDYLTDILNIIKTDFPDKYGEMTTQAEGKSANITVENEESFDLRVSSGEVEILASGTVTPPDGLGVVTNETAFYILDGKETPIDAYFRAEITAQAKSSDLYLAYKLMKDLAAIAAESESISTLIEQYRTSRGL